MPLSRTINIDILTDCHVEKLLHMKNVKKIYHIEKVSHVINVEKSVISFH